MLMRSGYGENENEDETLKFGFETTNFASRRKLNIPVNN